jgi:hypothetical protein
MLGLRSSRERSNHQEEALPYREGRPLKKKKRGSSALKNGRRQGRLSATQPFAGLRSLPTQGFLLRKEAAAGNFLASSFFSLFYKSFLKGLLA